MNTYIVVSDKEKHSVTATEFFRSEQFVTFSNAGAQPGHKDLVAAFYLKPGDYVYKQDVRSDFRD